MEIYWLLGIPLIGGIFLSLSGSRHHAPEINAFFSFLTLLQMTGFGVGMLIAAPFYGWWTPGAVVLLFHGIPLGTLLTVKLLALRRGRVARSSPTPVP